MFLLFRQLNLRRQNATKLRKYHYNFLHCYNFEANAKTVFCQSHYLYILMKESFTPSNIQMTSVECISD
jgi:hypothetical protein